ncbi:hypothetical protein CDCA_CDCA01G0071 [Cyanidium caldarium]|uniref:Molybdate-anion transporter n=1 Tax=Cyanidium caldarium TaxID=2771 RepID=A0AAV9IPQ5_CYACA|nr:hypothetical protein CDCA_CDCA01G0071 [Cyanidium caldarium]
MEPFYVLLFLLVSVATLALHIREPLRAWRQSRKREADASTADKSAAPGAPRRPTTATLSPSPPRPSGESNALDKSSEFFSFQRNYLLVFLAAVTADWLQGPMVYALYDAYGFGKRDIALLFITGFGSSMVFGTYAGSLADQLGRKTMAMAYGVTYALSCATKHSRNFYVLLLGRALAGVATSLLFSVFEAWYVYEHTQRGYPLLTVGDTFSKATFGNGVSAILSGQVAGAVAARFGYVAPFDVAILCLLLGTATVYRTWNENYGNAQQSVLGGMRQALAYVHSDTRILWLGVVQSCFEAAMYAFVFMWTPMLQALHPPGAGTIPHGMIFSTFMMAFMFGSLAFKAALQTPALRSSGGAEHTGVSATRIAMERTFGQMLAASAFCLAVAALGGQLHRHLAYAAMVLFEVTCGFYFPAIASLRSRVIPEECRSALMNFFRLPMNLLVVLTLLYVDRLQNRTVFGWCTALVTGAAVAWCRFLRLQATMSGGEARPSARAEVAP